MINPREFAEHPISPWEEHYFNRGQKYRVNTSFVDADGIAHPVGEEWTLIGSKFHGYDQEYTLCIRFAQDDIRLIRLEDASPQFDANQRQHDVINNLRRYISKVS